MLISDYVPKLGGRLPQGERREAARAEEAREQPRRTRRRRGRREDELHVQGGRLLRGEADDQCCQ